jgi:hypothetical protein
MLGKNGGVRAHDAFGASGHHERDAALDFVGRNAEALSEGNGERERSITTGEVVDAAVAFGFA